MWIIKGGSGPLANEPQYAVFFHTAFYVWLLAIELSMLCSAWGRRARLSKGVSIGAVVITAAVPLATIAYGLARGASINWLVLALSSACGWPVYVALRRLGILRRLDHPTDAEDGPAA